MHFVMVGFFAEMIAKYTHVGFWGLIILCALMVTSIVLIFKDHQLH